MNSGTGDGNASDVTARSSASGRQYRAGWLILPIVAVSAALVVLAGLRAGSDPGPETIGVVAGIAVLALVAVVGPLQRWRPVEPVTDRATIHTDILYTVLHRLGLFRLALFFSTEPLFDELLGRMRVAGWETFHLDAIWPGVTDSPLASLLPKSRFTKPL